MARRPPAEQEFGSDSFLDVITNVVGILIILVLVVGQHAKQILVTGAAEAANAEVTAARAQAEALEQDVRQAAAQMARVQQELAARMAERSQLNTLVTAIEQELAARRAALDKESQRNYDHQRDMALAKDELAHLEAQREQASQITAPKSVKVESYPTPISKTVDEKEVHFQLIGGRITFVPFEALIDKLKNTVRDYSFKMEDQGDVGDTLGPIGGFRLRYALDRVDTPRGSYIQLARLELLPTSSQLGEPMEQALAAKSGFLNKLEMMSPQHYTITIWTYADSFAEFARVRKELYGMGYRVAGRPLPMGMPIGASPHGSKSAAE